MCVRNAPRRPKASAKENRINAYSMRMRACLHLTRQMIRDTIMPMEHITP